MVLTRKCETGCTAIVAGSARGMSVCCVERFYQFFASFPLFEVLFDVMIDPIDDTAALVCLAYKICLFAVGVSIPTRHYLRCYSSPLQL